jgi:hypothetical protein
MEAEISSFDIKKLPYTARFGIGSTKPIKRWARFTLMESGDLYWTRAIYVRKDCDSTNIHISVHHSGEIYSSRYVGSGDELKKVHSRKVGDIGGPFRGITGRHQVENGNELLEPGYLYHGLPTLTDKTQKADTQNKFVACLDEQLVNARLYYSLDLAPWTGEDKTTVYLMTGRNQLFAENDPRCHAFIFHRGNVSAVVAMKFTEGDCPIDIQLVLEADKHPHPLKRLFVEDTLTLSESTQLMV